MFYIKVVDSKKTRGGQLGPFLLKMFKILNQYVIVDHPRETQCW